MYKAFTYCNNDCLCLSMHFLHGKIEEAMNLVSVLNMKLKIHDTVVFFCCSKGHTVFQTHIDSRSYIFQCSHIQRKGNFTVYTV